MEEAVYIICKVLDIKDLKSASLVHVLKRPSIALNGERKQIMIHVARANWRQMQRAEARGREEKGQRGGRDIGLGPSRME